MPDNQIFSFIDTPNFICEITSDFDQPHTPLVRVKLTSADALVSFNFFALPQQLIELSQLFAVNSEKIEQQWQKIRARKQKK